MNFFFHNNLNIAIKGYDLHEYKTLVGGLFLRMDILKKSIIICVYLSLKRCFLEKDEMVFNVALNMHKVELGTSLCIKVTTNI